MDSEIRLDAESALLLNRFVGMLWLEHGLSEHTQSAYRKDLELFGEWLSRGSRPVLVSAGQQDILDYLSFRLSEGAKPSSSARALSSLRRFYRYLAQEGVVPSDPSSNIESPRMGRKLPVVLSESDVERLLSVPDCATALGLRDYAMMDLMYSSGLRVSELVSLKTYQYHADRGFLRVTGKGAKERLVPMAQATIDSVERYLREGRPDLQKSLEAEEVLFPSARGREMTRQTFWHRIKLYAKQLGLPTNLSPHTLRHAFATHLVNNGADLRVVQMLLGHNSLSTTQIYTFVAQERMQDLHAKHHPRG